MTKLLTFLAQHATACLSSAVLLGVATAYLSKKVGIWGKQAIDSAMDSLFKRIDDISDPERKKLMDALFLDLVKLAEHEVPKAGSGDKRFEVVATWATTLFPALAPQKDKISALIENAVFVMDEELKLRIASHQVPVTLPPQTPPAV